MADTIPDNVLFLAPEGRLGAEDVKGVVARIEDMLTRHERIGIVTDATKLDGLTVSGFREDMRQQLSFIGRWDRFPRVALIADKGPMRNFADAVAAIVPHVTMRTFRRTSAP